MIRSLSAPLRASSRSSSIPSILARPSATSTFLSPSLPLRRPLSSSPSTFFPDYRTPEPTRSTYQSRYDKLQLLLFRVVDEPAPNPDFDSDGNPIQHSKRQIRTLMVGCTFFAFICWAVFQPSDTPDLDQDKWWAFPIEWMEVVDQDEEGISGTLKNGQYKVLTVRMPDEHKKVKGNVETGEEGIYHIMVKDPNLQIERVSFDSPSLRLPSSLADFSLLLASYQPYTIFHPPGHITGTETQLSILVKKEPGGEVSKFIHGRKRFHWIELRGPFETKTEIVRPEILQTGDADAEKRKGWSMEGWDRVVMVSSPLPPTRRASSPSLFSSQAHAFSHLSLFYRSPAEPESLPLFNSSTPSPLTPPTSPRPNSPSSPSCTPPPPSRSLPSPAISPTPTSSPQN